MQAPNELLTFLARNQFLTPTQVETLNRDKNRFVSSVQLCGELVQRNWITPYQQAQLLSGHGDKLIIGSYRLQSPLGEGGMGMVFKAIQPKLDRLVALKVIRPQVLAARPEILSRFHREARAIAQLNHPNIVILYDADEANGVHFIAMEYVEGMTLEKMVRTQGTMSIKQACEYIRQCALGLQHAYEIGMVHRDIKPSNILVSQKFQIATSSSMRLSRPQLVTVRDRERQMVTNGSSTALAKSWGMVKILDMGLARLTDGFEDEARPQQEYTPLTRAGALLGTPDFIAPEQARDARSVDIRADLYSLGCTLYYILTGKPPFPGGTDVQKLIRHQTEKPFPISELRPGIPDDVVRVLGRLLEKRPEDRYPSPQALADALDHIVNPPLPRTPVPSAPIQETPPVAETPVPPPVATRSMPNPGTAQRTLGAPNPNAPPRFMPGTGMFPAAASNSIAAPSVHPNVSEMSTPQSKRSKMLVQFAGHQGMVGALAISADGGTFASAGIDGRVRLWDSSTGSIREVATFPRPGAEFQSLTFAPHDDYLVVGGTVQGTARVWRWSWKDGRVAEWGAYQGQKITVPSMAFSADGSKFVAAIGSFVVSWKVSGKNAGTGDVLKGHGRPVRAVAFAPDSKRFASGGEGRSVLTWGYGWLGTSQKAKFESHTDIITSLSFSPDGSRLATAGVDRVVTLWDTNRPQAEDSVPLFGHNDNVRLLQFMSDNTLISVGEGGHVLFWDTSTATRVGDYQLSTSVASSVAVSADGRVIVTGSTDGKLTLFDVHTMSSAVQTII